MHEQGDWPTSQEKYGNENGCEASEAESDFEGFAAAEQGKVDELVNRV